MISNFRFSRHNEVAEILHHLDTDFLARNQVLFAGGTVMAMTMGEYRRSDDIDFLVRAGSPGLKNLRENLQTSYAALFTDLPPHIRLGTFKRNQYGFQGSISVNGQVPIKLEIFIESRITELRPAEYLDGIPVPCLNRADMAVQKLLANGDRYADRHIAHRDLYDLAMLVHAGVDLPAEIKRAEQFYTVEKELRRALELTEPVEERQRDFAILEIDHQARPLIINGLNRMRALFEMGPLPPDRDA